MPPANDDIANAQLLTVPTGMVDGTTIGATPDPDYWGEKEVWYKWTVTEPCYLRGTFTGDAGFRPYAEVLRALDGLTATTVVDGVDIDDYPAPWFESGAGGTQMTSRGVVAPGDYYMAVMDWDFTGAEGDFHFFLEFIPILASDLEWVDTDTANDPGSTETTFAADPYDVMYMRVGRTPEHNERVDFDIRKSGQTSPNDDYVDRYYYTNPIAICPNDGPFFDFNFNFWNNRKATFQDAEPDHAGFPARKSLWFQWDPTPGVPYDIWVESTEDDYVLSVYEVASVIGDLGAEIASDDDSGVGDQPLVTATNPGTGLIICVDSKGDGGQFTLNARLSSATHPPNDDFADREILSGTAGVVSGDLTGATYECGPGGTLAASPTPIGGDIWYGFTPTGNDYTLTWDSPNPVRITIYRHFTDGTPVYDSTLQILQTFPTSAAGSVTFGVNPGQEYVVRVEQADNAQDTIDFTWATPTPEVGDQFVDAPDLTPGAPVDGGSFTYDWDLTGAGQQTGEPLDSTTDTIRSVWRKFTPAHDCTYWTKHNTEPNMVVPPGAYIDVWRGTTIGSLDLVAGEIWDGNRGDGFKLWFGVRLRKGEQYYIRISNKRSSPPVANTMRVDIEYEMDDPWSDGDGWDSETGTAPDWTDGVLTFGAQGYRTINPWVGGKSSLYPYISFDVRLESEWSPTAADGPVLGRQAGPWSHYPAAGSRITVLRMHIGTGGPPTGSGVLALDIVGDRDGNSRLETWNELGGGSAQQNTIWNHFALPNAETEGGEWINVEVTPIGIYVQGRLALEINISKITDVDWGPFRFPTREGWDPGDDPPETWTLQLQNMYMSDRLKIRPLLKKGPMISEFDTRLFHTPAYTGAFSSPVLYPMPAGFFTNNNTNANPVLFEAPNPSDNINHQFDAVRLHDQSGCWSIRQRDNAQRHNGFWVTFDAFPNAGESVVVGVMRQWSGTQFDYYNDLCRLEVNDLGELWIYPYRFFQRPRMPGYPNYGNPFDPISFQAKIVEPRKQKIGQMALNEAYWIETMVDFTFPWDAVMRVAVNEVECFPEYRALVNQTDNSRISFGRYSGAANPLARYNDLAIGTPTGIPFSSSSNFGYYTGHGDVYVGPWFVGRGGLFKYAQRNLPAVLPTVPDDPAALDDLDLTEPLVHPGIGAHAGAVLPAATRSGTHRIPVASTLDKFETTPAAMAAACDGFFEYQGVRLYKGPTSVDKSLNYDMSLGTTGFVPSGIGAAPSLPPTNVADGSGPVGPHGDDYSGENALQVEFDPSAYGGPYSHTKYGQDWEYIYVGNTPPEGVREGGEPDDDGGNHFLILAWMRRVGGTTMSVDMCYDVRGDIGAGPEWAMGADEAWHWLWGNSYPNYGYSGGTNAYGVWRFFFDGGSVYGPGPSMAHVKQVHQFMNARTYPRYKVTTDDGASSFWIITPTEPVHTYLSDDPNDGAWQAGIFMDNVCPFERFDRTGPYTSSILTFPTPLGYSMGDYRPRRYVEVKPPNEADLEDMNVRPSALKVVVKAAGYGVNGAFGDVSTARANGTLKVRMMHGDVRHVVDDFPVTNTDKILQSQCIPMTPSGFSWQSDRVSELTTRLGFGFHYSDKGLNDEYGYRINQAGSAICKSLVYEVLAESVPGPPICTVGGRWKARLTRKI